MKFYLVNAIIDSTWVVNLAIYSNIDEANTLKDKLNEFNYIDFDIMIEEFELGVDKTSNIINNNDGITDEVKAKFKEFERNSKIHNLLK